MERTNFRIASLMAEAYTMRPPVSTKYVNARLDGSPTGKRGWTVSS